jgi:ATP-binding cassette subfamily B protein
MCVSARHTKFLSYYKPYLGLLGADILCAVIVSATTLILPLCARYITKNILEGRAPDALSQIFTIGALMLALVVIHALCNTFVDYRGHMMGTLMESDMRRDLFAHYQKLSFRFYDQHKTGQLMSRITNDLESVSELCHHGPEDLVIGLVKFVGAFGILLVIDVELTCIIFAFFPIMIVYALYFNRKVNIALRISKERAG